MAERGDDPPGTPTSSSKKTTPSTPSSSKKPGSARSSPLAVLKNFASLSNRGSPVGGERASSGGFWPFFGGSSKSPASSPLKGAAAAGGANKKTDTSVKENVDEANEAGDQPSRKQSPDPLDDLISGLGSMQIKSPIRDEETEQESSDEKVQTSQPVQITVTSPAGGVASPTEKKETSLNDTGETFGTAFADVSGGGRSGADESFASANTSFVSANTSFTSDRNTSFASEKTITAGPSEGGGEDDDQPQLVLDDSDDEMAFGVVEDQRRTHDVTVSAAAAGSEQNCEVSISSAEEADSLLKVATSEVECVTVSNDSLNLELISSQIVEAAAEEAVKRPESTSESDDNGAAQKVEDEDSDVTPTKERSVENQLTLSAVQNAKLNLSTAEGSVLDASDSSFSQYQKFFDTSKVVDVTHDLDKGDDAVTELEAMLLSPPSESSAAQLDLTSGLNLTAEMRDASILKLDKTGECAQDVSLNEDEVAELLADETTPHEEVTESGEDKLSADTIDKVEVETDITKVNEPALSEIADVTQQRDVSFEKVEETFPADEPQVLSPQDNHSSEGNVIKPVDATFDGIADQSHNDEVAEKEKDSEKLSTDGIDQIEDENDVTEVKEPASSEIVQECLTATQPSDVSFEKVDETFSQVLPSQEKESRDVTKPADATFDGEADLPAQSVLDEDAENKEDSEKLSADSIVQDEVQTGVTEVKEQASLETVEECQSAPQLSIVSFEKVDKTFSTGETQVLPSQEKESNDVAKPAEATFDGEAELPSQSPLDEAAENKEDSDKLSADHIDQVEVETDVPEVKEPTSDAALFTEEPQALDNDVAKPADATFDELSCLLSGVKIADATSNEPKASQEVNQANVECETNTVSAAETENGQVALEPVLKASTAEETEIAQPENLSDISVTVQEVVDHKEAYEEVVEVNALHAPGVCDEPEPSIVLGTQGCLSTESVEAVGLETAVTEPCDVEELATEARLEISPDHLPEAQVVCEYTTSLNKTFDETESEAAFFSPPGSPQGDAQSHPLCDSVSGKEIEDSQVASESLPLQNEPEKTGVADYQTPPELHIVSEPPSYQNETFQQDCAEEIPIAGEQPIATDPVPSENLVDKEAPFESPAVQNETFEQDSADEIPIAGEQPISTGPVPSENLVDHEASCDSPAVQNETFEQDSAPLVDEGPISGEQQKTATGESPPSEAIANDVPYEPSPALQHETFDEATIAVLEEEDQHVSEPGSIAADQSPGEILSEEEAKVVHRNTEVVQPEIPSVKHPSETAEPGISTEILVHETFGQAVENELHHAESNDKLSEEGSLPDLEPASNATFVAPSSAASEVQSSEKTKQITFDIPDKSPVADADKTIESADKALDSTFTPGRLNVKRAIFDKNARRLQRQAELLEKDKIMAEKKAQLDGKLLELQELQRLSERQAQKNAGLREVLVEYDRTISEQIEDKARLVNRHEAELEGVRAANAQATDDLSQAEAALQNVRNKYDRLTTVIKDLKRSEDKMKADVEAVEARRASRVDRFEKLRREAEQLLSEKSSELDRVKSEGGKRVATLQVLLRRAELKITNLEGDFNQKTTENQELCKIADELISKTGV